jgi:hypothetical protein
MLSFALYFDFCIQVFYSTSHTLQALKQGFQARCATGRSKALSYRLIRVEHALLGALRLGKEFSTVAQKFKVRFWYRYCFSCFKILYKTIIVPLLNI